MGVAPPPTVVLDDSFAREPAAMDVRVASSHLRVGSSRYAWATGDVDLLRRLLLRSTGGAVAARR